MPEALPRNLNTPRPQSQQQCPSTLHQGVGRDFGSPGLIAKDQYPGDGVQGCIWTLQVMGTFARSWGVHCDKLEIRRRREDHCVRDETVKSRLL